MTLRRIVLVVGPALAGVDGVIAALRARLPEHIVVGVAELAAAPADVAVAVVSAVAPATRTDWEQIERAASGTDLVVGVVSKVDAHRRWREVLEADRTLVAGWSARGRTMPWVGVTAAPDLGEPRLSELVALLRECLADPAAERRRHQRGRMPRADRRPPPVGPGAAELRSALARTRLHLLRVVRNRCATTRAELRDRASAVPVGGSARFESEVQDRARGLLVELDDEITRTARAVAVEFEPDTRDAAVFDARNDIGDLARAPTSSRRLEGRLMAVLGVGFGLGIALASSRLLAGLAPGPSFLGLAVGFAVGLALLVWVVRVRGLLHDRAVLDRWVTDVAATVRWHGEAMVAERLLAVESACVDARSRRASGRVPVPTGSGHKDVTDQYEW